MRDFTGIQQVSNTYYGSLYLESLSEHQVATDPTVSVSLFQNQIDALSQMTSKLMHHDTITGTTLQYIIYN